MPTVTKSIGTSSRNYSTITSWEADLDNSGIYASGDTAVGDCYNDSTFVESPTINGGHTVGLAALILQAASGQGHAGTAGTGVIVQLSGNGGFTLYGRTSRTLDVIGLEFEHTGTRSGNSVNGIFRTISDSGGGQKTISIQRCLFYSAVIAPGDFGGVIPFLELASDGSTVNIFDSIVYDVSRTDAQVSTVTAIRGSTVTHVYNTTVDYVRHTYTSGTAYGVYSTATVKNCTSTTSDDADYSTITTASYNLSSDATASGTGSLTSKTAANQFVSTTAGFEDYHLKAGADAIDAGTDLATTPTNVQFDIDNYDRDTTGVTWDMGADEFVGASGQPAMRRLSMPVYGTEGIGIY